MFQLFSKNVSSFLSKNEFKGGINKRVDRVNINKKLKARFAKDKCLRELPVDNWELALEGTYVVCLASGKSLYTLVLTPYLFSYRTSPTPFINCLPHKTIIHS